MLQPRGCFPERKAAWAPEANARGSNSGWAEANKQPGVGVSYSNQVPRAGRWCKNQERRPVAAMTTETAALAGRKRRESRSRMHCRSQWMWIEEQSCVNGHGRSRWCRWCRWWPRRTIRSPTVGRSGGPSSRPSAAAGNECNGSGQGRICGHSHHHHHAVQSGCTDGVSKVRCVRLLGARVGRPGQQGLSAPPIPINATPRHGRQAIARLLFSWLSSRGGRRGRRRRVGGDISAGGQRWSAGTAEAGAQNPERVWSTWSLLAEPPIDERRAPDARTQQVNRCNATSRGKDPPCSCLLYLSASTDRPLEIERACRRRQLRPCHAMPPRPSVRPSVCLYVCPSVGRPVDE
ncbi:hypothetical protein BC567DRAFT_97666 [Phyllosticta citribraziliensis]